MYSESLVEWVDLESQGVDFKSLPDGESCVEEGEFVDVSEFAKDMG